MNEEILIDIESNGDVRVEGKNIAGPDCVALTKDIEHALGEVASKKLTPDYRRVPQLRRKAGA